MAHELLPLLRRSAHAERVGLRPAPVLARLAPADLHAEDAGREPAGGQIQLERVSREVDPSQLAAPRRIADANLGRARCRHARLQGPSRRSPPATSPLARSRSRMRFQSRGASAIGIKASPNCP